MNAPAPRSHSPQPTDRPYLMESEREARRLAVKTRPDSTKALLQAAGLEPGMRAVDVGCGSHIVPDLMSTMTGIPATGLDFSESRWAAAVAQSRGETRFECCEASSTPFEDGRFDFAWSRFLFEYLEDPMAALMEMRRITRPGGIVAVADLDAQLTHLYPLSPKSQQIHQEALRALSSSLDIQAGRKLPSFFGRAGFREIRARAVPHQVFLGDVSSAELLNWRTKFETVADLVVSRSRVTHGEWEKFSQEVLQGFADGSIFYYSILIVVTGRA